MLDISWNVPPEDLVLMDPTEELLVQLAPILRGPAGPAGTIEEDTMYSKRVDFITDDLLYRGEALVGSLETAPLWRVRKIVFGLDGDVTETWAAGTANFDKVWADRLTFIYT